MAPRRRQRARPRNRFRIALVVGVGIVATLAVLAFLWTASGLYNVAASKPHWAVTEGIIAFGLRRSVATHSMDVTVPPLDTPEQIRLGAAQFETSCASCHGSPDASPSAVTRKMLPPPPGLNGAAARWDAAELGWIIENGLKYTGMPAWPAEGRRDEVWPLVSFLRALPMTPANYRALAGAKELQADRASPAFCATCHASSGLVPPLEPQSEAYLVRALGDYADGSRPSGIMGPIAQALSPAERTELAAAFAGAPFPAPAIASDSAKRGRLIAEQGVPARDVPACLACHGGSARADYPVLAGLPAPYLTGQLKLWQQGGRAGTPLGALMAGIAKRLTLDEIRDLSAFFAGDAP